MVCGKLFEVAGHTNAELNTIFGNGGVSLYGVRLLFLGCNSVQSGSLLPTFWKQEVHSKWVNQLSSKLSNNLSDYTTCNMTVSVIASAVRQRKPHQYVFLHSH
jgi:hypothetical protein